MKSNKNKLYRVLNNYIKGSFTTEKFCREIEILFFLKLEDEELNEKERILFKELAEYVVYYCDSEEDLKKIPVYVNQNQIKDYAIDIYKKLNS